MKINRNMSAVITNRQLLRTENKLAASMERLSSGYKINNAGDNPAGIAISSKMRAQIAGLDQAETNASDGESVLNIADGALNEVSNILQRIRELAVQAANDTNTYSDRQAMQDEIDELTKEVDRISTDTEYNSKNLLDGSCNRRVYSKNVERLDVSDEVLVGDYKLTVTEAATQAECSFSIDSTAAEDGTISISGVSVSYTQGMDSQELYESLRNAAEQAGCELKADDTDPDKIIYTLSSTAYGSDESFSVELSEGVGKAAEIDANSDSLNEIKENDNDGVKTYSIVSKADGRNPAGTDAEIELDTNTFAKTATYSADGKRITITDAGGFSIDFMLSDELNEVAQTGAQDVNIEVTDLGSMTLQVGSNQYQEIDVNIPAISSESLYLDTIDVTVVGGANKAIATIDDAISKLGDVRSAIGAYTNRLEYAQKSLAETQEDLTAAFSNLMDTDMAEEITVYTEQNVLEQATISVLSQANDIPQQILSLLS